MLTTLRILLFWNTLVALAFATPQNIYAPFSGAIYIVDPNGQPVVNSASASYCPSNYVSCSGVGPSWCCPASYTCVAPYSANGLIGCCPSGQTCGGQVAAAAVSTYTVQAYATVVAQTSILTVQATVANTHPTTIIPNGFCSTMIADGPGLPTARQGDCGMILVVSGTQGIKGWLWRGLAGSLAFAVGAAHFLRVYAWA